LKSAKNPAFLLGHQLESKGAVSVGRTALKSGKAEARGSFEKLYKDQVQMSFYHQQGAGPADVSGAVVLCW
jgi:hypothetical protein